jgi:hypothetical protein
MLDLPQQIYGQAPGTCTDFEDVENFQVVRDLIDLPGQAAGKKRTQFRRGNEVTGLCRPAE